MAVGAMRRVYARGVATPPVLDRSTHFPGSERFAERWLALRDEADGVASHLTGIPRFHELLPNQASISANDGRDWRMFVLKAYGVPVAAHLRRCPVLARLLAEDRSVLSAAFSFLAPGKHIPEHSGPFRGIMRFHLNLRVPAADDGLPGTVLRIDGTDHRLGDGETLLWDDTFRHEVWNRSAGLRVALLLDVRRERLPMPLTLLTGALVGMVAGVVRFRLATGKPLNVG